MNVQQLRIVRETVRQGFNLTSVADALCTSQSGVSKHIKDLENELGIEIFVRKGKRLLGLTAPGKELIPIVERVLADLASVRNLSDHFAQREEGRLVIATTHAQATYALPEIIKSFNAEFPRVHLLLHQASPPEIVSMLRSGEADIGLVTDALAGLDDVATFPFHEWHHGVLIPRDHPLAAARPLTLQALAGFPIVTYHHGYTGRARIDASFAEQGLTPKVVLSALDSDVIKTYVELGLGVGIVTPVAFSKRRDNGLLLLEGSALFPVSCTLLGVRKGHYLRDFACRFIEGCAPGVTAAHVRRAIEVQPG